MADESDSSNKTEDPTQKRLDDAHAKGDVAKSQEVNTWFVIAGATLVLSTFSGSMGGGILMPLLFALSTSDASARGVAVPSVTILAAYAPDLEEQPSAAFRRMAVPDSQRMV